MAPNDRGPRDDELVTVEAGKARLAVSKALPDLIERLGEKLRPKAALRRMITRTVTDDIRSRLEFGLPLDDHDADFVAEALSNEAAAKWVRREAIHRRAAAATAVPQLPAAAGSPSATVAATSDDWVNKFLEDAGLVSDEMIAEVYARVLASEARCAGSVSLRTLRALRYLDAQTAGAFGALAELVLCDEDSAWVPARLVEEKGGIPHMTLCGLEDAGLLDMLPKTRFFDQDDITEWVIRWSPTLAYRLRVRRGTKVYEMRVLRVAGEELLRIADRKFTSVAWFLAVGEWLQGEAPSADFEHSCKTKDPTTSVWKEGLPSTECCL